MALRRRDGRPRLRTCPSRAAAGYRLGNRVFKCWKKEGHGSLDLIGAVAKSCDVYFYQLGQRLGLDAIIEDGVLMGFHDRSGIDLPSEQEPVFPADRAYFDKRYGARNWSPPATILNFAIGQGENTQTLINMVKFYAALAGDGKVRAPLRGARAAGADARPRAHARAARRACAGRSSRWWSRAPPRRSRAGPRRGGQDRHRAELARQGPWLVHRVRAGRQSDRSSSAPSWSTPSTARSVAPYVVQAI